MNSATSFRERSIAQSVLADHFPILPRLAFITGRIALIFQNPLLFTSFFRNFAPSNNKITKT